MTILKDKKVQLGIGIGIIFSTILITLFSTVGTIDDATIEMRARGMGMIYEDEAKVLKGGEE